MAVIALAGCGSHPSEQSAGGHSKGRYKVGAPYQIDGVWYYPREDFSYDETGIASWYGEQFAGRATANGEVFDLNDLTAAHRTLPIPSIVQVTNLDNGRSIKLRVNDRGPYARGRIIDVSRRAAQMLGFETNGTAKVRVQIVVPDSIQVAAVAGHNSGEDVATPGAAAPTEAVAAQSLTPPPGTATAENKPVLPPPAPVAVAAATPAPTAPIIEPAPAPAPSIAAEPVSVPEPILAAKAVPAPVVAAVPPPVVRSATSPPPILAAAPPIPLSPRAQEPIAAHPVAQPPTRLAENSAGLPSHRLTPTDSRAPPVQPRAASPHPATMPAYVVQRIDSPEVPPMPGAEPMPEPMLPEPPPLPGKVTHVPVKATGIYVQAGAFSRADNAHRLESQLRGLGSPIKVVGAAVNGVPVYRVRIGPLSSVDEADQILGRVVSGGAPGAHIVVD